jgi:hypothetical protein
MRTRTTLFLLLAVAAVILALRGLDGDGAAGTPRSGPLFPGIRAEAIQEILLHDPTGERWPRALRIVREEGRWRLLEAAEATTPTRRARAETVDGLIGALLALRPLRQVAPAGDGGDLFRFGLDAGRALRVIARDAARVAVADLSLGASTATGELLVRAGEGPVVAIPVEVSGTLLPNRVALEDGAVFTLSPLDVERLELLRPGQPPLVLEREFARWFLRGPAAGLADTARVDDFKNRLLQARVAGRRMRPAGSVPGEAEPHLAELRLHSAARDLRARFLRIDGGALAVDLPDEEEFLLVDEAFAPDLARTAAELRDRHLLDFRPGEVTALVVDGPRPVRLARSGTGYELWLGEPGPAGPALVRGTDLLRVQELFERLRTLRAESRVAAEAWPGTEAMIRIDRGATAASIRLEIGPRGADGRRLARVDSEAEWAVLAPGAADPLLEGPEGLLEPFAQGLIAYFRLARLEIQDGTGRRLSIHGHVARDRDWGGDVQTALGPRPLAPARALDIKNRLIALPVLAHLREPPPDLGPDEGLHLQVRFLDCEDARPDGIPADPTGRWITLRVGRRRPDGTYPGTLDTEPPQAFLLDQSAIQPFFDLLSEER